MYIFIVVINIDKLSTHQLNEIFENHSIKIIEILHLDESHIEN